MLSNYEIRKLSRKQLEGNWLKFGSVNLVSMLVTYILMDTDYIILGFLCAILFVILQLGTINLSLNIANNEKIEILDLLMKARQYGRFLLSYLLIAVIASAIIFLVFMLLFALVTADLFDSFQFYDNFDDAIANMTVYTSLLLIVILALGVVAIMYISYCFAFVFHIIIRDNEEITSIDAMKYSYDLMQGYKFRLFCLQLSFVGWFALSMLTLGVALIFLRAYVYTSWSNFYLELLKEKEEMAQEYGILDDEYKKIHRDYKARVVKTNDYTIETINI